MVASGIAQDDPCLIGPLELDVALHPSRAGETQEISEGLDSSRPEVSTKISGVLWCRTGWAAKPDESFGADRSHNAIRTRTRVTQPCRTLDVESLHIQWTHQRRNAI